MTYRNDIEAENLKLKAQLEEACKEIERLKPKPVQTPVIVLDAEERELNIMAKRLKKQRPSKAQVKAISDIGDALKLNGFIGEDYWSHKRDINYVSVSIGFDYQLHVRVIHGSIKEGWEVITAYENPTKSKEIG